MEAFVSRKRRRLSPLYDELQEESLRSKITPKIHNDQEEEEEEDSTDVKLATLASLYPHVDQDALLDSLVEAEGSIASACQALDVLAQVISPKKKGRGAIGYQTSLAAFRRSNEIHQGSAAKRPRTLTRKGQTLHLYTPEDIAAHTPCSIIHNFLPAEEAEELLKELLEAAPTFERQTFKLFDNVVQSPHSACFYVDSLKEQTRQKTEYLYNGSFLTVGFGTSVKR